MRSVHGESWSTSGEAHWWTKRRSSKSSRQVELAGAALDVYADEPNVPQSLRSLINVVLAPHIGSATVEAREAMARLMLDNLNAFF